MITLEKLVGSENYLSWSISVELWFMGQGYEDHLVTQEVNIPEVDRVQWRKIDAHLCSVLWQSVDPKILLHLRAYKTCFKFWNQAKGLYTNDIQRLYKVTSSIVNVRQQDMDLSTYIGQIASLKEEFLTVMPLSTDVGDQRTQIDKFFMVLTLIGLRPDLETVRDQILGSSSVPSLDDVFARLLRISSTQTLPSDNTSDSSVLVSQTNSRGGRSGNRGRGQRPHCTYCNKLGHTRDRCYQLHGRPPRTAQVAQSSDPSRLTSQFLHISGKITRTLNYSITFSDKFVTLDWSMRKMIGIGRHPSLSKFQKMVPCFFIFVIACVTNFLPKPQNASSWDIPDFKRVIVVIPLRLIATFSLLIAFRPLQVYHRRHRVAVVPPSLTKVPVDSLPIPLASPAPALPPSADLPIALWKGWRQAMVDEMTALHSNDTWDFVVLPSSKSTVGCRWVYTVKVGLDGQVDRLKARLVAKGYTQVYGSDYGDTFSPVAKIASGESGLVCRLHCSLYGLKQSPRAWFSRFSSVVQEFGMFRNTADHSVFYHHNSLGQCIYLVVYVDDIVITGSDQNDIQKLKQHLFTHFQTKDLGKLKYFLGIQIAQSSFGVVLSQRKYA
ncbi:Retrovirus-related Pol polyprotein from transposon RE1 [Vitis vinifera]|uniref:Retrovirus-related Pol polyprotein from transposon RE1 n=1 Tax=Vitis vinifera TaxID=29760 RepID=A0A438BN16_VITVI|nr:Retrovirus-related Pol polyprotein from transposon RE1 [Vitis vinifera]